MENVWQGEDRADHQARDPSQRDRGQGHSVTEAGSEEELKKKLLDAVWRLLPEGFKVRHEVASETAMTITATERTLTPEQIALGMATQKEMEVS